METKYLVIAVVGKSEKEIGRKVFDHRPLFGELNRWLNRQAIKYGAHPGVKIIKLEQKEVRYGILEAN